MHPSSKIVVIGAGVFGAWTALRLRQAGHAVTLLDAHGPGNSRSSSGGETRIIRMSYGADELYARWSIRSLALWQAFFATRSRTERATQDVESPFFVRAGMLWLGQPGDQYTASGFDVLTRLG